MHCLTNDEVSQWLQQRGVIENPYYQDRSPEHYLQFRAPKEHGRIDGFMRCYFRLVVGDSETLVHITDWGLYEKSQMIPIMGIRSLHSETRWLIDAPGHSLDADEAETGISLVALTASFEWSSYLYCPTNGATLYNWEGDLFDFWTDDRSQIGIMRELIEDFGLRVRE